MDKREFFGKLGHLVMLKERLDATGVNQDTIEETMRHALEQVRTRKLEDMDRERANFHEALAYAGLDVEACTAELVAAINTGDQSKVTAVLVRMKQRMKDAGVIINDKSRPN